MNGRRVRWAVIFVVVFLTGPAGLAQVSKLPPPPGGFDIAPAYYYESIRIVADGAVATITLKDYTKYQDLPESDRVLVTLPPGKTLTVEISGKHPQMGYDWDDNRIEVGTAAIRVFLYTRTPVGAAFPDAIEGFRVSLSTENLPAGTFDLLLCEKRLGRIEVK
ncbi:MAG: hypothetical protein GX442_15000 [Candidatus Riflebacteria bacterium]|nr:hypothetical protein [Candidatus Riflebacteria bacterium]